MGRKDGVWGERMEMNRKDGYEQGWGMGMEEKRWDGRLGGSTKTRRLHVQEPEKSQVL